MKSFADRMREDRRLVIRRLLSEQGGYRANSSILHAGLTHLGVAATQDDVLTDLAWLSEQSLIALDQISEHVQVATLSAEVDDATRSALPRLRLVK